MNTLAFAFGVVSTIAVIIVAVVVLVTVKVLKQNKQINSLFDTIRETEQQIYQALSSSNDNVYSRINDLERVVESDRKEIMSYIDSRIDKTLESKKKQQING
jgi:predicted PurR-regulated permease PerM